jgi:hypothetical protein
MSSAPLQSETWHTELRSARERPIPEAVPTIATMIGPAADPGEQPSFQALVSHASPTCREIPSDQVFDRDRSQPRAAEVERVRREVRLELVTATTGVGCPLHAGN